jgi:hypothetical protein
LFFGATCAGRGRATECNDNDRSTGESDPQQSETRDALKI